MRAGPPRTSQAARVAPPLTRTLTVKAPTLKLPSPSKATLSIPTVHPTSLPADGAHGAFLTPAELFVHNNSAVLEAAYAQAHPATTTPYVPPAAVPPSEGGGGGGGSAASSGSLPSLGSTPYDNSSSNLPSTPASSGALPSVPSSVAAEIANQLAAPRPPLPYGPANVVTVGPPSVLVSTRAQWFAAHKRAVMVGVALTAAALVWWFFFREEN